MDSCDFRAVRPIIRINGIALGWLHAPMMEVAGNLFGVSLLAIHCHSLNSIHASELHKDDMMELFLEPFS